MLKRIATLLLGIGLIGLGVFFFISPERSYAVDILMRYWPLFLVFAGLIRVAGYLLDRHPKSPVGGMVLAAIGGILLAAHIRGENSLLSLATNYWFWLLLAYIVGRVLRQYTHDRFGGAPQPRAFTTGSIALMVMLVAGGISAGLLQKNEAVLGSINIRLGKLVGVRDYIFGNQHQIEDDPPQEISLSSGSLLLIDASTGDVEVTASPQSRAIVRLVKRIRSASEDEAKAAAAGIHLQIVPDGNNFRIGVAANGLAQDFNTKILVTLPTEMQGGVQISNALGAVKLAGLKADCVVRQGENIEIVDLTGRMTIESPRGSVSVNGLSGDLILNNSRRNVEFQDIAGSVTLESGGGNNVIKRVRGLVRVQLKNGRIEISEIGPEKSEDLTLRVVELSRTESSRAILQDINGAVLIDAKRTRLDLETINGDLDVTNTVERINAKLIKGAVRVNSVDGAVNLEGIIGQATVDSSRDITVRNFRSGLNLTSRIGLIDLMNDEKIVDNIKATSTRGRIKVTIPEDSAFRVDALSEYGRIRIRGFEQLNTTRQEKSVVQGYNISDSSPALNLRSGSGEIQLVSGGIALAGQVRN